MLIERGSGHAIWRQIEQSLAGEIARRVLSPGSKLPPEPVLAERFGVNRHTVRRAVAALERDGLVRIEQGRGTFVQEHAVDYMVSRRTRFSENLLLRDKSRRKRLLRSTELPARGEVARALGLRAGAMVIRIEAVTEVDERPLSHSLHHFPGKRFPGIAEVFRVERSVTKTFARFDIADYTRQVTRISARMPDAELAAVLHQPRTRPVLQTVAVNIDAHGSPIEFGLTHFAGDLVQLVIEPE
jgi:GntR family phosphonate transport system transcriptional regulator